ncbi:LOW QUALITY PROTEIN: hypothetical protein PFTANZ_05226 [Plasmodium falciparum Tanzania (2000708)]|uniref:Uncharacterized protein n=4 Tax=Plasmodium falciparum TaxID=5833 RepID=A0A024W1L7_PLAFA|nr:LOW QUALITY PROTEIN: hypothetical protein PFFVO_04889 [Plasmodium falciparum Vietnam Oak-Knoll (FVO)]ETW26920.1 LOW QUALITY PROTEIN: hypothetical protein PFFCH_05619 [Plasmodium falciparum FCH/4]ETW34061.1 LOW QUALITY PROTEIN: hypothetical protein PFTANZ_05226 [Plasmodium falciparum Tanzania (2000708)]ETW40018.1 LOW QUALITY PROTEIN: hypothetical protein PFNF135_06044 [Plasmodium falciparum NF135/5.C10]
MNRNIKNHEFHKVCIIFHFDNKLNRKLYEKHKKLYSADYKLIIKKLTKEYNSPLFLSFKIFYSIIIY